VARIKRWGLGGRLDKETIGEFGGTESRRRLEKEGEDSRGDDPKEEECRRLGRIVEWQDVKCERSSE